MSVPPPGIIRVRIHNVLLENGVTVTEPCELCLSKMNAQVNQTVKEFRIVIFSLVTGKHYMGYFAEPMYIKFETFENRVLRGQELEANHGVKIMYKGVLTLVVDIELQMTVQFKFEFNAAGIYDIDRMTYFGAEVIHHRTPKPQLAKTLSPGPKNAIILPRRTTCASNEILVNLPNSKTNISLTQEQVCRFYLNNVDLGDDGVVSWAHYLANNALPELRNKLCVITELDFKAKFDSRVSVAAGIDAFKNKDVTPKYIAKLKTQVFAEPNGAYAKFHKRTAGALEGLGAFVDPEKDIVLLPLSVKNHWCLIWLSRTGKALFPEKRTTNAPPALYIFDSLALNEHPINRTEIVPKNHKYIFHKFTEYLRTCAVFFHNNMYYHQPDCPIVYRTVTNIPHQPTNSKDCGAFVATFIEMIAQGKIVENTETMNVDVIGDFPIECDATLAAHSLFEQRLGYYNLLKEHCILNNHIFRNIEEGGVILIKNDV